MPNIELLKEQNPWWIAKEKIKEDVNLEKLLNVKYKWCPAIIDSFNLKKDVIYTLRGSRQIGKTTLLKILIEKLLKENPKENVFYFTCNNVDDYKELIDIFQIYFEWIDNNKRKYIFVDEITFVKNWTRGVKHLSDLGKFRNCTLILSGSNSHDLKHEIERMPGRRGQDPNLDKILFPVSFKEYVEFEDSEAALKICDIKSARKNYPFYKKKLKKYLNNFLLTGGFIKVINNFAANGRVDIDVYQQYLSWVLGDLAKLGKKEVYSRQIFERIIESITTNIGFDTIARKTSINSHLTVESYLDIMESNFIIKILYQIDMNKKTSALRKTKKMYFQDMFLLWVFLGYVYGLSDYFSGSKNRLDNALFKSKLIENLIMSHLMKLENSVNWSNIVFFFRNINQTEVDFIIRGRKNTLMPIEVKYQNKVTPKDFLNLDKVNREKGIIISKEDFFVQGGKWVMPPEVFLLINDQLS